MKWYDRVQKQFAIYTNSQEAASIKNRNIFLFGMQGQNFVAKWLSEGSINWTALERGKWLK